MACAGPWLCYNVILIGEEFFMDHISREEIITMLSFKGFTTDALMKKSDEELDNLYIEYIVLAEDYV
jgi:hypothetical protein